MTPTTPRDVGIWLCLLVGMLWFGYSIVAAVDRWTEQEMRTEQTCKKGKGRL